MSFNPVAKITLLTAALVIAIAIAAVPISAGPWITAHREGYIGLSASSYRADALFIGKTRTPFTTMPGAFGSTELEEKILTLYAEYGILPRTSLSVTAPYIWSDAFNAFGFKHPEQNGVGDVRIMVNRVLYDDAFALTASAGARIAGDYNALLFNAPGEGSDDFLGRLSVGKSFDIGFFLGVDGTYAVRGGAVPDVITIYTEAGFATSFGLTPRVFYSFADSRDGFDLGTPAFVMPGGPSGAPSTPATGFPGTREDASLFGGGLDYSYKQYSVGVNYVQTLENNTRNTANGRTFTVTTGYRF